MPIVSESACFQSHLTGYWYTYGGDVSSYERCKIRVNAAGTILGGYSNCYYRDDAGLHYVRVKHGGSLTTNGTCTVKGKITLCDQGICFTARIENGKLDSGKSVMSLVGYAVSNPELHLIWTAIKPTSGQL